jgi:hypothetical protein
MISRQLSAFVMASLVCAPASAVDIGNVSVTGHYLGVYNDFHQQNRVATDPERRQFDYAANIDVNWKISDRITGLFQLQGGPGGGGIPLGDPQIGNPAFDVVITDLAAVIKVADEPNLTVTLGSFDMPFGSEVANLTNNANATGNPFFLNDIFYSPFGGLTGTLNTVGALASASWSIFDATAVVSNGTDESATNPDGKFAFLGGVGVTPVSGLRIAASYLTSDDTEPRGNSGLGANLEGWMVDGRYEFMEGTWIRGYYGNVELGDENPSTRDDVRIWAGEMRHGWQKWHLAARISGWDPDDDDGSGAGMSAALRNPGLALNYADGIAIVTDQSVRRLQIGVGYQWLENFQVKAEWFQDNYDRPSGGRTSDVSGVIFGVQGAF